MNNKLPIYYYNININIYYNIIEYSIFTRSDRTDPKSVLSLFHIYNMKDNIVKSCYHLSRLLWNNKSTLDVFKHRYIIRIIMYNCVSKSQTSYVCVFWPLQNTTMSTKTGKENQVNRVKLVLFNAHAHKNVPVLKWTRFKHTKTDYNLQL